VEFKTILVQIDHPDRARAVISTALNIADQFESLVIGLYVVPSLDTLGALASGGAGPAVMRQRRTELLELASQCQKVFESTLGATEREWSWSVVESKHEEIRTELLDRARTVDLVVLSQTPDEDDVLFMPEPPESLLLESGRPVVVVPVGHHASQCNLQSVMVAWDGSREANRALSDSLPLLQRAQNVRVVWAVDSQQEAEARSALGERLSRFLARHGVTAQVGFVTAEDSDVPALVDAMSQDGGYDLLVCGAYGESRVREFLLGGVTRYLLDKSQVPLLMAH